MAKRMLTKYMLPAAIFMAAFMASTLKAFAGDPDKAIITSYDTYSFMSAVKGGNDEAVFHEIVLRAKLEEDGALNINPDIKGEELSFYIDGNLVGKGKTDDNGFAGIRYLPVLKKSISFTVKLEGMKKYSAKADSGLVYYVDPKKPTMICDIDWTVSNTDKSSLILKDSDDESTPLKDSPLILTGLHEHYNIIFITGREDALLQKTREWLARWKFPRLPVLFADLGQTPYINQDEYKEEAVAKVKADLKSVVAGIGDQDYDAKAYLKSGLKALIIKKKGEIPAGAVRMNDWNEIKKELMKQEYIELQ